MLKQKGFVLALVLWILTALSLVAGFFAAWTQQALEIAQNIQNEAQADVDMYNTKATLIYLFTTQPHNFGGLSLPQLEGNNEKKVVKKLTEEEMEAKLDAALKKFTKKQDTQVAFDEEEINFNPTGNDLTLTDQAYYGFGKIRFAIQDKHGLLSIGFLDENNLERLLGLLGVPVEQRQPLSAKFQDFIDFDDLHRINGAESRDYKEKGLKPPLNRKIRTIEEIQEVMDWKKYPTIWENDAFGQLTNITPYLGTPNFNTAPFLVLQSLAGMDAGLAQKIVSARKKKPIANYLELNEITGNLLPYEPEQLAFFASNQMRLTLWYDGQNKMRQIHLTFMPFAAKHERPWQIDYLIDLPLINTYRHATPTYAKTPVFAATLPTTPR
jgi:general secretion pathway protein K